MRVALAAAWLAGCAVELPAPSPRGVEPSAAYNGEDTLVTITGEAFFPQVEVDATGRGADVDAGFTARLLAGEQPVAELRAVGLLDTEHLQAVVPAGIEPGRYALQVVGPTGAAGRLDAAFTVTDTRAERLDVDLAALVYEVYDTAWLEITLVDRAGDRVLADLPITVSVAGESGPVEVAFDAGGLDEADPLPEGEGVRGRLGADGRARVGVSVGTPGVVDLTVSPEDPDSAIADGLVRVLWEPGSELSLTVDLPSHPFVATAGEPFPVALALVDQFGNPVPDAREVVLLKNACETWVAAVQVPGSAVVDVQLRTATGTAACREDRVGSVSGPPGESVAFAVLPGPARRYDVVVTPTVAVAGRDPLNVLVTPVDAFGNLATAPGAPLSLTWSTGEMPPASCVGATPALCTATPRKAGDPVTVTVSDGALVGTSNAHAVHPAAPVALELGLGAAEAVAGEAVEVVFTARDAFGNAVDLEGEPAGAFTVSATTEAPACVGAEGGGDGRRRLACTLTRASDSATLTGAWGELVAAAPALRVVNGPLAAVAIAVPPGPVVAGAPLSLAFSGVDAFGNPYRVQADPRLSVADRSGTLELDAVTLGADGTAAISAAITAAGPTFIAASSGGVELGRSAAFVVEPAAGDHLAITAAEPWAWVGEPVDVELVARDRFGNVAALDATVSLGSGTAAIASVAVPLVGGRGAAALTWDAPAIEESIVAAGAGLTPASAPLPVVVACADGPAAAIRLDGAVAGRICSATGAAAAGAFVDQAAAGAAAIAARALAVGGEVWRIDATGRTVALSGYGRHPVRGLLVDARGCADEAWADAWLGPDDGSATGPIAVSPAAASAPRGGAPVAVTLAGARTCRGAPAAGAQVGVRVDRGAVLGASPTGVGLAVSLDVDGAAALSLALTDVHTGGPARLVARSPTGSAHGEATVLVTGDVGLPRVVRAEPAGRVLDLVDTVTFEFSEALDPVAVGAGAFRVDGPVATAVVGAQLAADGREVTLTLDPPVPGGAGAYTAVAGRELTDLAGNPLDGAYVGAAFDFSVSFGAVPAPPPAPEGCVADPLRFRPDGEDGPGEEADAVGLAWSAPELPRWWVIEARDAAGARVRSAFVAPVGAEDAWAWDGRDDAGAVVPAGTYTAAVLSEDAHGNRVAGCAVELVVDLPGGSP